MKKILLAAMIILLAVSAADSQVPKTGLPGPDDCRLYQNISSVPGETINIKFYLNVECRVKLFASNRYTGQVTDLIDGDIQAGLHGIVFKSPEFTAGEYICTLQAFTLANDSMFHTSEITLEQINQ